MPQTFIVSNLPSSGNRRSIEAYIVPFKKLRVKDRGLQSLS